ncbi:Tripeptidyl aminopeptidase precursor [Actinomyces howellii]|uniref:Tripeptidyl aminopeptidase n=1 Tax=Actinomyces howellii TaxID=52771 RepID=A0A3S4RC98_9ACTO|nr:Tripeptidyl aminopeptidase precursor [Actinomyces howellii]
MAPASVLAALCLTLSACAAGGAGSAQPTTTGGASAATSVTPAPVPAGLESFYGQKVSWKACEGAESGDPFRCATVKVPLDYDDPSGPSIDLAVKKLPAASGRPMGTLLVNPGGPGGSGVAYVSEAEYAFSDKLRQAYDIVGFDPRGVGASTPLTCLSPQEIAERAEEAKQQGLVPQEECASVDKGQYSAEEAAESGRSAAAACETNSPVPRIIDHMDTESVARDLDVLRGVSGDPRLNYLGVSYGTYLGARYAELFPGNVGRMVLDSAVDPSLGLEQRALEQAASIEETTRTYMASCMAAEGCPFTGSVDEGMAQLKDLIEKAKESPLATRHEGVTVDGDSILGTVVDSMYDSSTWEQLTAALRPAVVDHDGSALLDLTDPPAPEGGDSEAAAQEEAQAAANEEAYSAVSCLDYPVEGDRASWDEYAARITEVAPTTGDGLGYSTAFCQGWGRSATHTPAKITASGAAPILVLGVTGDPATPYAWSQALASQLESGRLVTLEGAGHGAYMRQSSCLNDAVDAYLLTGELPAQGLRCTADESGGDAAQAGDGATAAPTGAATPAPEDGPTT